MPLESARQCVRCAHKVGPPTRRRRCARSTCKYYKYCWQHSKHHSPVVIRRSQIPNAGDGLYTIRRIPANTEIVPYAPSGILRTPHTWQGRRMQYPNTDVGHYGIGTRKHGQPHVIDGRSTQSGLGRYVNECRPNAKEAGHCAGYNAKISTNTIGGASIKTQKAAILANREIYASYHGAYDRSHYSPS